MKPTQNDIKILFNGKPEEFINQYKQEFDNFVSEEEFLEFNNLDDSEKMESLFEFLFTIPVSREDDDDEVVYALAEEFLPYEVDAEYAKNGLSITIDKQSHFVPLKSTPEDRYTVIRKLDSLIKPKFETRVMKVSLDYDYDNDDMHSIIILEKSEWDTMESEYGKEKISEYFEKIDNVNFE